MTPEYREFFEQTRRVGLLQSTTALLDWDQETTAPPRATAHRAEQLSLLARITHETLTSPRFRDALAMAEIAPDATDDSKRVNLREMRRVYDRAAKLPTDLVAEEARVVATAKEVWSAARRANDYPRFAPHLERILQIKREIADHIGFRTTRYDALLDEFEPGAQTPDLVALFTELRPRLVDLVRRIAEARTQPDRSLLTRPVSVEAQRAINLDILTTIGFDLEAGRLDVSTHPFCTGITPRDVRLTTRYNPDYAPQSIFGTLHEAGHGLYEQGLPADEFGTPMAQAVSMGIHESQSRLWENLVGRGGPFWAYYYPRLQQHAASLRDVPHDAWLLAINAVRPSLIRVEADEVTYGLHIILRFELERALLDGQLAVADLPGAWRDAMKANLNITPACDSEGCLQDIHWSMGAIGYFPTYQIGNMAAAQFYEAALRDQPELERNVAGGRFGPLLDWLRDRIHRHGKTYRANELIERVTGSALSAGPYFRYLESKFSRLFGF